MKRATLLGVFVALFCCIAWAEIPMIADPSQPAATGEVSLGHDQNGNVTMSLHVRHLADPQALTPAQNSYAVWVQAPDKQPEYVGNLSVDKNLKGEFKAPVPYRAFDVFVTAESNLHPDSPGNMKVLHATVQAKGDH